MGLNEDAKSPAGRLASMRDVDLKQWLFYRNLYNAVRDELGEGGLLALKRGLVDYATWRGNRVRNHPDVVVSQTGISQMLASWDGTDLLLAATDGRARLEQDGDRFMLELAPVPGRDYYEREEPDGDASALSLYWTTVLPAFVAEYGAVSGARASTTMEGDRLVMEWYEEAADLGTVHANVFQRGMSDAARAISVTRMMSQNAGALYMFVARAVIRALDATGELVIRSAVRSIGVERGTALRQRHEQAGLDLNMKTLMSDWDGPLVSVWQFADEGYLSESTWHQDCTWCPYADVWASFGPEGLALGELYDVELHTSMYGTYLPGIVVEWDTLMTRGDSTCGFRFSMPHRRGPSEPVSRRELRLLG